MRGKTAWRADGGRGGPGVLPRGHKEAKAPREIEAASVAPGRSSGASSSPAASRRRMRSSSTRARRGRSRRSSSRRAIR